jgi:hypothetical protein
MMGMRGDIDRHDVVALTLILQLMKECRDGELRADVGEFDARRIAVVIERAAGGFADEGCARVIDEGGHHHDAGAKGAPAGEHVKVRPWRRFTAADEGVDEAGNFAAVAAEIVAEVNDE